MTSNSQVNTVCSTQTRWIRDSRSATRRGALLRFGPAVGVALLLAACAPNPADAQSATPERVAEVRHACADTMQLDPTEAFFEDCSISLMQTLAAMDQAQLVERDRRACMQRGLQPGTREFALCVVDAEQPGN